MIVNLDKNSFSTAIQSEKPILVDFWATWCTPCLMQGEVLHQIDDSYPNLQIGKVNVDDNRELAIRFHVDSIPTMIMFQNGEPIEMLIGLRPADVLLDLFKKHGADV
ncbi:MAG: thioredoxin [Oscillospiraceae bacterium]